MSKRPLPSLTFGNALFFPQRATNQYPQIAKPLFTEFRQGARTRIFMSLAFPFFEKNDIFPKARRIRGREDAGVQEADRRRTLANDLQLCDRKPDTARSGNSGESSPPSVVYYLATTRALSREYSRWSSLELNSQEFIWIVVSKDAAWLGSLANGPFADYIGRRLSIIVAVIVFLVGSIIQAGAVNLEMLYIVSITIGILLSYWIDYGSNYIGGTRSMIYYSPTIFGQLDLEGNRTSLLATGVYGIANCLSTLPALFWIDKVGLRVLLIPNRLGPPLRNLQPLHPFKGYLDNYLHNIIIGLTLEDMDLVFGDTAAHEEQQRIVQIEAALRGTPLPGAAALKESLFNEEVRVENV
ncbi:hypothetical protein BDFG_03242 [Blastomyces dermatitidis ATCC 26199]|nr:hypothetical protein BDFG_03242 [Blastomyces dermatitidis ATCC 26199]